MNEQQEIDSLYSSQQNPVFEKYMSLLFPYEQEEYTNFGYWKELNFPSSIKDISKRITSQRQLYLYIQDSLSIRPEDRIVEIGCGKGYGVNSLCQKGFQCFGIDALNDQIKSCHSRHRCFKDHFVQGFAESIPFQDAEFDALYSIEAAQHFSSFENFCSEAVRVLRNGGKFSLTTFFLNAESKRQAVTGIIPPTVEGIDRIVSIEFAVECLQKAGFLNVSSERIGEYVLPQFAQWQKIIIHELGYPPPPKDKAKWARYYSMDNTDLPHPWMEAYQKRLIDYFVIKGCK